MSTFFRKFASQLIRVGSIEIEEPGGERFIVGDGVGAAPLVKIADEGVGDVVWMDLAIHMQFSNAPSDQLCDLGTKVKNEYLLVGHGRLA